MAAEVGRSAGTGTNRMLVLVERPTGVVSDSCFELREGPVPEPGPGEVLVRTLWLSCDPTQRGWLIDSRSQPARVALGDVMGAYAVGQVVRSEHDRLEPGRLVQGRFGWQEWAVAHGDDLVVALDGVPPQAMLGVYGTTGVTAYFGVLDVARPRPGDTAVVSGAAGGTGSVAGQIARIAGCRTIGIAGGPEKCAWLTGRAGFDAAIDHRAGDVGTQLDALAPEGVDVYFDNVGGPILDDVLARIRPGARIALCGGISTGYVPRRPPPGPSNYFNLCLRSATMQGFRLGDFADRHDEARARLRAWVDAGEIVYEEDVVEGLEHAPAALRRLFEGRNLGKQLVRVADAAP